MLIIQNYSCQFFAFSNGFGFSPPPLGCRIVFCIRSALVTVYTYTYPRDCWLFPIETAYIIFAYILHVPLWLVGYMRYIPSSSKFYSWRTIVGQLYQAISLPFHIVAGGVPNQCSVSQRSLLRFQSARLQVLKRRAVTAEDGVVHGGPVKGWWLWVDTKIVGSCRCSSCQKMIHWSIWVQICQRSLCSLPFSLTMAVWIWRFSHVQWQQFGSVIPKLRNSRDGEGLEGMPWKMPGMKNMWDHMDR